MPPLVKHVGISFRSTVGSDREQSGYIVQHNGSTVGGFHKSYKDALAQLSRAKGVPIKMLKLKVAFRKHVESSHVPYIRCHAYTKRWYSPQVPLGKSFATEDEAIKAVKAAKVGKNFLATAKKNLVKGGGKTKKQLSPAKLAHRIKCLIKFTFADPQKQWLPADACAAAKHRHLSKQMYACDPALHFLSLVLKYGPWKDALLHAWKQASKWPGEKLALKPKLESTESSSPEPTSKLAYKQACIDVKPRARAVKKLLVAAAKAIHDHPVDPAWSANANRFGGRFNGPAIQLH